MDKWNFTQSSCFWNKLWIMQRARCQEWLCSHPGSTSYLLCGLQKNLWGGKSFLLPTKIPTGQGRLAGVHRTSCTGEQRKDMLLISCDTMHPTRTWLFCFLCLLLPSWAPGRGGCSQFQRVPQGAEQWGWEPPNELCEAAQIFWAQRCRCSCCTDKSLVS